MDLRVFELHNVWMGGSRAAIPDTAARCEHCGPLTRFVTVTQSLFRVEGGVIGEINVPQRGSATPAGSTRARPVTTTSGEINVPQRGSAIPAGSTRARPVTTTSGSTSPSPVGRLSGGQIGGAVLTAAGLIAGAVLTQYLYRWVARNNREKWSAEQSKMIVEAIEGKLYWINFYGILPRLR
jgi:hypothetical protein